MNTIKHIGPIWKLKIWEELVVWFILEVWPCESFKGLSSVFPWAHAKH